MNGFGFDADFCRDFNRFRVLFVGIRLRVRIGERERIRKDFSSFREKIG